MKQYVTVTKLSNIGGRADYISNPARQECVVAMSESVDWQPFQNYERNKAKDINKRSLEGREFVLMLPNEWSALPPEELVKRGHLFAKEMIGEGFTYQFAYHWNKTYTNFHIHIIFSERQKEKNAGRWDRDIYLTADGKVARKKADRARAADGSILPPVHRKGELKGEFTARDPKFKNKSWLIEAKSNFKSILLSYGVTLEKQGLISQYHEGKGSKAPAIRAMNELIKASNYNIDRLLEIQPKANKKAIKDAAWKAIKKGLVFDFFTMNNKNYPTEITLEAFKAARAAEQSKATEPVQQLVEIPRPDFTELVAAHQDVKLKEAVLKKAKSHIFEEREVRYNIIKVPEQLRSTVNLMWNAYSVQQDVVQQMAALHRPVQPKGMFVSKTKKEQYEKDFAAYKEQLAPLQEYKQKAETRLQACFEVLQEYLRPNELQRQGYGSNAPMINPVAMDDRDMYQIKKMVTHRIENKHDGYQMLADREQRLAKSKENVQAAENALNLAQEHFDKLIERIPVEHKEEAKQAVREADRANAEQERTPPQQKKKSERDVSD